MEERRRGPDAWVKAVRAMGIISFVLLIALLMIIAFAKPYTEGFLDRFAKVTVVSNWNDTLLRVGFTVMLVMALVALAGLLINYRRARRKSDKFNFSLILSLIASVVGGVLYFIYYFTG